MRIATWNVERPKNATSPRSRRLLTKLQEIDADIWILTETNDAISPGPDYHHLATEQVLEPPTRHAPGERRTIVWSRWPIVKVIDEDLRQHPDCALCVAGDFNQTRKGRLTYGTRWGRHLLDQALEWGDLRDTTTPRFAAKEAVNSEGWLLPEGQQPIDHICLSRSWTRRVTAVGAWSGRADSGYLSDHSGVWIELE